MSAIKQLQGQAKAQMKTGVPVDITQRFAVATALRQCGKFSDVRIKLDSRRGSLSVILRKASRAVQLDANVVQSVLSASGFRAIVRLTSGGPGAAESIFRFESLSGSNTTATAPVKAAPVKASTPKTVAKPSLAAALTATQAGLTVSIHMDGKHLGYVDAASARQIEAIVAAANRPKTKLVSMVNSVTGAKETVELPYDVAMAVEQLVPSFVMNEYHVKSTSGLVWVTNSKSNTIWISTK